MRAGRGIDVLQPNAGTVVRWCCIRVDLGRHGLGHGLLHVLYITVRYGEHEFSYSYIVELATTPLAVPDRKRNRVFYIYLWNFIPVKVPVTHPSSPTYLLETKSQEGPTTGGEPEGVPQGTAPKLFNHNGAS